MWVICEFMILNIYRTVHSHLLLFTHNIVNNKNTKEPYINHRIVDSLTDCYLSTIIVIQRNNMDSYINHILKNS